MCVTRTHAHGCSVCAQIPALSTILNFDQCGLGSVDMSGYVRQVAVQINSGEQEKTCPPVCVFSTISNSHTHTHTHKLSDITMLFPPYPFTRDPVQTKFKDTTCVNVCVCEFIMHVCVCLCVFL